MTRARQRALVASRRRILQWDGSGPSLRVTGAVTHEMNAVLAAILALVPHASTLRSRLAPVARSSCRARLQGHGGGAGYFGLSMSDSVNAMSPAVNAAQVERHQPPIAGPHTGRKWLGPARLPQSAGGAAPLVQCGTDAICQFGMLASAVALPPLSSGEAPQLLRCMYSPRCGAACIAG